MLICTFLSCILRLHCTFCPTIHGLWYLFQPLWESLRTWHYFSSFSRHMGSKEQIIAHPRVSARLSCAFFKRYGGRQPVYQRTFFVIDIFIINILIHILILVIYVAFLILSFRLRVDISNVLFYSGFSTWILYNFSSLPCVLYSPTIRFPCFHRFKYIWQRNIILTY